MNIAETIFRLWRIIIITHNYERFPVHHRIHVNPANCPDRFCYKTSSHGRLTSVCSSPLTGRFFASTSSRCQGPAFTPVFQFQSPFFITKYSLVYIILWAPTQSSWSHLPTTRCTWTYLRSSMPPVQLTRHYRWRTPCTLFTLGNRCISCYTDHATYMAFPLGHLRLVFYLWKQVHILICHPCNISKESSDWYPTWRKPPKSSIPKPTRFYSYFHANYALCTTKILQNFWLTQRKCNEYNKINDSANFYLIWCVIKSRHPTYLHR